MRILSTVSCLNVHQVVESRDRKSRVGVPSICLCPIVNESKSSIDIGRLTHRVAILWTFAPVNSYLLDSIMLPSKPFLRHLLVRPLLMEYIDLFPISLKCVWPCRILEKYEGRNWYKCSPEETCFTAAYAFINTCMCYVYMFSTT